MKTTRTFSLIISVDTNRFRQHVHRIVGRAINQKAPHENFNVGNFSAKPVL